MGDYDYPMNEKCLNCGGDYGIHQSGTDKCPFGGVEAYPRPERWMGTTFLAEKDVPERVLLREIYDALSDMTTEEFSLGGDKEIRNKIAEMLGIEE